MCVHVNDSRALTGDEGQNNPFDAVFLSVKNTVTVRNMQRARGVWNGGRRLAALLINWGLVLSYPHCRGSL